MLVGIDRHRAPRFAKHFNNLLVKFETRIKLLLLVVEGVIAVFADEQHAVNSKFPGTQRERLRNRFHHRDTIRGREPVSDISGMDLIHIKRDDVARRWKVALVNPVAFEKPALY